MNRFDLRTRGALERLFRYRQRMQKDADRLLRRVRDTYSKRLKRLKRRTQSLREFYGSAD